MTRDTKGVRQVLEAVIVVGFLYGIQSDRLPKEEVEHRVAGFKHTQGYKDAQAALQEIMLGMLPEKIKLGKAVYKNVGDGYASERIGYKHGFNDALADMEQNIRGGFNNG